jgi:F-type H+-transporting ATPase subunit b
MNLNLTLLGQMITFSLLVIFTMKYIWPLIAKALQEREATIANGLAAAERGRRDLELAQHKVGELLRDAKLQAAEIVDQASKRATRIVEDAKEQAHKEGNRLIHLARDDIEQERLRAKADLQHDITAMAVAGAAKILGGRIDISANNDMIKQLLSEVSSE